MVSCDLVFSVHVLPPHFFHLVRVVCFESIVGHLIAFVCNRHSVSQQRRNGRFKVMLTCMRKSVMGGAGVTRSSVVYVSPKVLVVYGD